MAKLSYIIKVLKTINCKLPPNFRPNITNIRSKRGSGLLELLELEELNQGKSRGGGGKPPPPRGRCGDIPNRYNRLRCNTINT